MRPLVRIIGLGFLVLLPLFVLTIVMREAVDLLDVLVQRLYHVVPRAMAAGPLADTAVALLMLLLLALVFGLIAITPPGLALLTRFERSMLATIPPFTFARGFAASLSGEGPEVKVVLVPADQGRTLAFLFGAQQGEHLCVYVPSAPNWTSGQIAFAAAADVQPVDLSFPEAARIIMSLGAVIDERHPRFIALDLPPPQA
jgi:uncharacterized membrane protein